MLSRVAFPDLTARLYWDALSTACSYRKNSTEFRNWWKYCIYLQIKTIRFSTSDSHMQFQSNYFTWKSWENQLTSVMAASPLSTSLLLLLLFLLKFLRLAALSGLAGLELFSVIFASLSFRFLWVVCVTQPSSLYTQTHRQMWAQPQLDYTRIASDPANRDLD